MKSMKLLHLLFIKRCFSKNNLNISNHFASSIESSLIHWGGSKNKNYNNYKKVVNIVIKTCFFLYFNLKIIIFE